MKKLAAYIKFALFELWNNRRFSILFCIQLSLGLTTLAVVNGLRTGVQNTLNERSKSLLAADLSVGARRQLTNLEIETLNSIIPSDAEVMETIETFTMLVSKNNTRLVELKAIDSAYPYYGEIELRDAGVVTSESEKSISHDRSIWITPDLALQLGLDKGSHLQIGGIEFYVSDIVERDASSVGSGFSFAPTVYLSLESLDETKLIQMGSTGYYEKLYRFPIGFEVATLADKINQSLTDPAIRVKLPEKASEQVGRGLGYVTDYLGLSSLVALFIAGLGIIYLLRRYLFIRRPLVGTMKAMGIKGSGIFTIYLVEIFLLGLGASALALTVAGFVLPSLSPVLSATMKIALPLQLELSTAIAILAVSTLLSLLLSLPLLLQFRDTRPNLLFQPETPAELSKSAGYAIWYLPAVAVTFVLAVLVSHSVVTGSLFFLAFWGAFGILSAIGIFGMKLAKASAPRNGIFAIVIKQILRERTTSLAIFVTLSVAFTLTSLIPQLKEGLKGELQTPTGLEQPSLFMFDIQDEQVEPLRALVENSGSKIMQASPMIRARLEQVNDQAFHKRKLDDKAFTREEENENRFRNRGFNLTYRQDLSPSERIVSGREFDNETDLPEVSLEERFAKRLDLSIGDRLTFDIQGIPIEGIVVNLRKVRWTSFQPNFFIQFAEGVLADAPKTHLMTVPAMRLENKIDLQNKIIKEFPNVSIIDVSKLIERLSGLLQQMSVTLQILAVVTLIVGAFILFTVSTFMAEERKPDVALMKAIGVPFHRIRRLFIAEFASLTFVSSVFGILVSILMAHLIGKQFFDSAIRPAWLEWFLIVAGGIITSIVVIYLATSRTLRRTTIEVLKERN